MDLEQLSGAETAIAKHSTLSPVLEKCTFKWTIENLKNWHRGQTISSPVFMSENSYYKWRLQLTMVDLKNVTLKLIAFNDKAEGTVVLCDYAVKHADKEICTQNEILVKFDSVRSAKTIFHKRTLQCEFNINSCDDLVSNLQINVNINYVTRWMSSAPNFVPKAKRIEPLFAELIGNNEFSDAIIKVDGREIAVHVAILAVRSPVFKMMFKNDMKEKETKCLEIEDFDYETVKKFVCFLYAGKVDKEITHENLHLLMKIGHKYEVMDLVSFCVDLATNDVKKYTISETVELLVTADLFEEALLKEACLKHISSHRHVVKDIMEFKALDENPTLKNELFIHLLHISSN